MIRLYKDSWLIFFIFLIRESREVDGKMKKNFVYKDIRLLRLRALHARKDIYSIIMYLHKCLMGSLSLE